MSAVEPEGSVPRVQTQLTEERRGEIIRLLQALTDGLPLPVRKPLSTLGFVHDAEVRESCPDCLANGFVSRDCEGCGGDGFLERGRRTRDPYDTGAAPGWFGSSEAKHARDRERDRAIARLAEQTSPPQTEAELAAVVKADGWELERDRLRERYDIDAAIAALERLANVDGNACRALHAVYVFGWLERVSPTVEVLLERGLVALSAWLPSPLRAPTGALVTTVAVGGLAARNAAIRRAFKSEAATSQLLARRHGLSVSQVNRILAGEDAAT